MPSTPVTPTGATTAALELEHVGLAEAVELTLIYLDKEPARYERVALRLHARLSNEVRWGFEEFLAALGLLAALRGRQAEEAAHALASLLPINQRFLPASKALVRWATEGRGMAIACGRKGTSSAPQILRDAYADFSGPRLAQSCSPLAN